MNFTGTVRALTLPAALGILLAAGIVSPREPAARPAPACAADNGGLTLPDGFCATVFADGIGHARHLVVAPNGVVYVNTWSGRYYGNDTPHPGGFLVALADTSGDGEADVIARFGDSAQSGGTGGTGIGIYRGALFAEAGDRILEFALPSRGLAPSGAPQVVVSGLPLTGDHPMHPFVITADGGLFVDLGSATNSCQRENRIADSPGLQPCSELQTRGGIWRYDANRTGQRFSPAERYATGIRNAVGIAVDSTGRGLYSTQHGRDQLAENWPSLYQPVQGANQPAEELLRIEKGADYGWPECYYDADQRRLVLAPEYGGDGGRARGACATKRGPIAAFPAHWAPNALLLYSGRQFPPRYRGGAFIAFHGSWNRAPFPQGGYNVVFVPFAQGRPAGQYEIFADGFAGADKSPGGAAHRPSGLAVGPDGAIYVTDDQHGRIWRISYQGELAARRRMPAAPARTVSAPALPGPPEGIHSEAAGAPPAVGETSIPPGVTAAKIVEGDALYHNAPCGGCHGPDARGTPLAPNLTDGTWIWGDGSLAAITGIIRDGVPSPKDHTGVMPPMGGARFTEPEISAVAAYVWSLSHTGR